LREGTALPTEARVHASTGSTILKGERALTVDHLKLLAAKFKVRADKFMS
jgi:antitoxin component HigA of HigAB toxin-antitoxin module